MDAEDFTSPTAEAMTDVDAGEGGGGRMRHVEDFINKQPRSACSQEMVLISEIFLYVFLYVSSNVVCTVQELSQSASTQKMTWLQLLMLSLPPSWTTAW